MNRDELDDEILAIIQAELDSLCVEQSNVPLPPLAQQIYGEPYYRCGLHKGHDGPHRWPADGRIAEWDTSKA